MDWNLRIDSFEVSPFINNIKMTLSVALRWIDTDRGKT